MEDVSAQVAPPPEESRQRATSVAQVRVRSLTVHQFRDVKPGTALRFGEGIHLVLGKNASGKSTLLELLAAVASLNFQSPFFQATPFHLEAELALGECSLRVEVKRTFEPVRLPSVGTKYIDLPPRDEAEFIAFFELPGVLRQGLRVAVGEPVQMFGGDPNVEKSAVRTVRYAGGANPLALSLLFVIEACATVEIDGGYRLHPRAWDLLVSSGTGVPYDESLGALDSIVNGGLNVVRGDGAKFGSPWLPPSLDFEADGEPVTRELSADPLLRAALQRLGYEEAKLYFGPGATWTVGWRYTSPSIQFFRQGRAVRRHDQLSYGEQRLFSFAWYLACNPNVAVADELVNGLHAEWLDWTVEALGERQSFLSAQSPLLVDAAAVRFDSEVQLRQGIILCESVPRPEGAGHELVWRQLDARESDLLSRAFTQSRLDLLSDLLHALELW